MGVVSINAHQHQHDPRLLTTHQPIIESTLSLVTLDDDESTHRRGQSSQPEVNRRHFYLEDLINDTTIGIGFVENSDVERSDHNNNSNSNRGGSVTDGAHVGRPLPTPRRLGFAWRNL